MHRINRMDLNAVSVFALFVLMLCSCGNTMDQQESPNVILIIIDTLNADHLGCYGYHRDTSPVIDSLASSGTMWARMQAQAPWTLPAMVSIYTGLTERTHRVNHQEGLYLGLNPELPTIATILNNYGYNTAGFVNVNFLGPQHGMEKGFQYFKMDTLGHGRAAATVDEFITWLDSLDYSEPFFVVFHLFDPHSPYDPPEDYATAYTRNGTMGITDWQWNEDGSVKSELTDHLRDLYDGEIRWVDSQLSRFFSAIRRRHLSENTLIVFTADHGEEFLEHGSWGHARNLYQQSLHVPLIISGPGIPVNVVDSTIVGQIDILPTILSYVGETIPAGIEGMDILTGSVTRARDIPSSGVLGDSSQVSILNESNKVIWSPVNDYSEMFDIVEDPMESVILDVDSILLSRVLDYWAWPCLWEPTLNVASVIGQKRKLHDLGYIR